MKFTLMLLLNMLCVRNVYIISLNVSNIPLCIVFVISLSIESNYPHLALYDFIFVLQQGCTVDLEPPPLPAFQSLISNAYRFLTVPCIY